jgi:hypothetical protein
VGARLDLGRALDLTLLGTMGQPHQAEAAASHLELTIRDLRSRRTLKILGLSPILERAAVRANGKQVRGHLSLPEERRADLAQKITFILEMIVKPRLQQP